MGVSASTQVFVCCALTLSEVVVTIMRKAVTWKTEGPWVLCPGALWTALGLRMLCCFLAPFFLPPSFLSFFLGWNPQYNSKWSWDSLWPGNISWSVSGDCRPLPGMSWCPFSDRHGANWMAQEWREVVDHGGIAVLSCPLHCHFRSLSKYEVLNLRGYKANCWLANHTKLVWTRKDKEHTTSGIIKWKACLPIVKFLSVMF